MLPHPYTVTTAEITLGIVCLFLFACWIYDYICLLKTEVKLSEAEDGLQTVRHDSTEAHLEAARLQAELTSLQKQYSEAIKQGIEVCMQLSTSQKLLDEALADSRKYYKQKTNAERLLRVACKAAQGIDELRLELGKESLPDGPNPGTIVPDTPKPAGVFTGEAVARDCRISSPGYLQGINEATRRYDQGLKTERTA